MLLLLALACAPGEDPICSSFATSPSEPSSSLHNEDSCGYWSVAVGEYFVVSVEMTEPDLDCESTLGEGIELQYDPTYSNLEDNPSFEGGPKWTWQIFGESPVTGTDLEIVCAEGSRWAAKVDVVE